MATTQDETQLDKPTLLIVDDDRPWLDRLSRAMDTRGYEVHAASSVSEGIQLGQKVKPAYAVVDMRLEDGNHVDGVWQYRHGG
jgi:two-component system response regulator RegA